MKYLVKMRNLKSGKIEIYTTKAKKGDDLQLSLDFWKNDAEYKIISVEEIETVNV